MGERLVLPTGTLLDDNYRTTRVVGSGGFGITYAAEDLRLSAAVAIKEYYPERSAARASDLRVLPRSQNQHVEFEWGRSRFLSEARTLARFRHQSIVRVTRVFEANSTAYMVMDFEQGRSLRAWVDGLGRPPTQTEMDNVVAPLLEALELLHREQFLHRDIAPDNIIVRPSGTPVLLDFGAARQSVAQASRALTGIVKAGYSPHEQYTSDSCMQGPWSDLYALGASLYHVVTGLRPDEATARAIDDRLPPAANVALGSYRASFLAAIDACLSLRPTDRPQSVAQLRARMFERDRQLSAVSVKIEPAVSKRTTNTATNPPTRSFVALAALLTLFGGACGGLAYTRLQQNARPIPAANETQRPWKIIGETAERRRALPAAPDQSDEAAHRQVINDCEQLVAADLKIRACTELIARNSQDAVAYSNRARAHILNNDAGSAIADATRAIEIDPALSMAYVARGISYGAAGDPSRAIADLSKAIEIDSRLVLAYQKRAHFYVRSKRLDLAIADYTRVIELEPTNASAFAARAVVHHQMGNYQKVIVDSTRAIELDPTNIRALNLRGIALSRKRDHDLAIADYNRAIELKSGNQAQLHVNRCVAYLRKNEVYLAISDCLQAAEIDSNYFEAHYNLAMAYRRNGENQKALVALNRSIEINAGHGGAYALRGQVFEALRRKSDAIADYRKALAIDHSVQKAKDGLKRLGAST